MDEVTTGLVRIFSISAVRYFVLAGVPFLAFYIAWPNRLARFKIQQRVATHKDFMREIWQSLQATLVFSVISLLIFYTPLKRYTLVYDNITDFPLWYMGLSLVLSLIVHDAYFYWIHRLLHHRSIFKLAHLVHHKSTNPSPWTSYSFHLLESVAEGGVLVVIVMIMPLHAVTVVLFAVVGFIINVYGHLGYEIMPRRFRNSVWFEILNTSVHHNMHHSRFRANYGLYFRIWDRLMGTEHPDYVKEYDRIQAQRFGDRNKYAILADRKHAIRLSVPEAPLLVSEPGE